MIGQELLGRDQGVAEPDTLRLCLPHNVSRTYLCRAKP